MKRLAIIATVLLLLADSTSAAEDLWTSFRDVMTGSWVTTGVIPEGMQGTVVKGGDEFRMNSTFWTTLDGKALIGRQTFRIVGNSEFAAQSHSVAGWNATRKSVDVRAYWSDGDIDEAAYTSKNGSTFVGDYVFTGGTGSSITREAHFKVVDQDTLVFGENDEVSTWNRVKSTGPKTDLDFVDYYSYFVGKWLVKVSDGSEETEGIFDVMVGPSGKCHITRFEFGDQNGDGIYGRDPLNGRWTGTGFDMAGTFWQSVFAAPKGDSIQPGMSFTIRNNRKSVDGNKENDATTLTIVDENTWETVSPKNSLRMVREDAKPLSPYYSKYEVLEMWIGDWTAPTKIGDMEFVGHFSCRWTPGKSCVAWTWRAPELKDAPVSPYGYGIFGWDPARDQIVELGFGSNGLAYTTYFDVKGNALHGTRHTVLPDGKKVTETMVFTAHKDRIVIKNIERKDSDGNVIPFVFPEDGLFERVTQE